MNHLELIRQRGATYRQNHPAYLRRDDLPMIDLQRRLPTLQDSLSPVEKEATTLSEDIFYALALTALGAAITYLLFGFHP